MAEFNRELPFQHAYGLVKDNEPFFFQNGFAFTQNGVEMLKDEMGNFSVLSTSTEGKKIARAQALKKKQKDDVLEKPAPEPVAEPAPETASTDDII